MLLTREVTVMVMAILFCLARRADQRHDSALSELRRDVDVETATDCDLNVVQTHPWDGRSCSIQGVCSYFLGAEKRQSDAQKGGLPEDIRQQLAAQAEAKGRPFGSEGGGRTSSGMRSYRGWLKMR